MTLTGQKLERALLVGMIVVVLLLGVGLAFAEPHTLTLQPSLHADAGSPIELKDLAQLDGPNADRFAHVVVTTAPAPRRRKVLTQGAIATALGRHGLAREQLILAGAKQIVIESVGQKVDAKRMEEAVLVAIASAALDRGGVKIDIEKIQLPRDVQVSPGSYEVHADPPQLDSGVLRVPISIQPESGKLVRVWAQARVTISGPMLVAARDVPRGQRLTQADLRVETRTIPPGRHWLSEMDEAIGRSARSNLKMGRPLRSLDLVDTVAVRPGQPVVAVFTSGSVSIEVETVARRRGSVGEIVPVAGIDGRGRLQARVTGPGRVALLGSEAR